MSSAPPTLSDADMDRFATLFSPATPPATPRLATTDLRLSPPATRPRKSTQGSADSDFGAFVSVPPSLDPLSHDDAAAADPFPDAGGNHSLVYFDRFTASAKTAAERHKREVLDELLHHQDDPMYFITPNTPSKPRSPSPVLIPTSTSPPLADPVLMSTDDALAEALASEMTHPHLVRGGSVKVALSPSRARCPLPPRLSGSASPPSHSSPTGSSASLPTVSTSTLGSTTTTTHPAHATLARLSSSLVSLLPATRPRAATASSISSTASAPAPIHTSHTPTPTFTHGSPFCATPYIPPSGAPGFAGDRAWDRGFSEVLAQEEERGLVDTVGLGAAHAQGTGAGTGTGRDKGKGKGKGVVLVGRRDGTTGVLTEDMADRIRPYLPALTKLPRHWTLLYSLDQHGISLNTLYARCTPRVPSRAHPNPPKGGLLVVRDAHEAVFGAWLSEGVQLARGGYYGSGEAFLWRYHSPALTHAEGDNEGRLDVYTWTGINAYVALCEPGFISFGGGDGHYGLYLDASLLDGSSAPCPTFGNPPLCAVPHTHGNGGVAKAKGEVSFECVGLEVWGVGQG